MTEATAKDVPEIKIGDVVEIKSGGPCMVVIGISGRESDATARVTWFFESQGEFRDDVLLLTALKKHAYQA